MSATSLDAVPVWTSPSRLPARSKGVWRRAMRLWRTRVGLAITLALVAIAIFGPLLAPHSPTVCRHTLPAAGGKHRRWVPTNSDRTCGLAS